MDLHGPAVGAGCALGSALTWAVVSLLVRTLTPLLNVVSINAIRSTVGGALLLAWIVLSGEGTTLATVSGRNFVLLGLSIAVAVGIGDNLFFESSTRVGLARAMTISMAYPLVILPFAGLLGERITTSVVVGSVVTLAGIVLIVTARADTVDARGRGWWLGVGAAAVAALAWGLAPLMMKAPLGEMDATTAQAVRLPIAAALLWMTPWTRGAGRRLREGGRSAVARMVAVSALTAVSSVMFVAGLKYAGVAVATVLSSTAPMFAIPLGFLFLGERLSPGAVVGCLITVAGIAILQLSM